MWWFGKMAAPSRTVNASIVNDALGGGIGPFGAVVPVEKLGDLPSAVGGVRTLASDTVYLLYDLIDLGSDVLVTSGTTAIRGMSRQVTGFKTNSSNPLLTSVHTIDLQYIRLVNPGGKCFELTPPVGGQINLENCTSVNGAQDLITGTLGPQPPVSYIRDCNWEGGFSGLKITGYILGVQFENVVCFGLSGSTTRILELGSGLVLSTSAAIVGCFFQTSVVGQTGLYVDPSIVIPGGGVLSETAFTGPGTDLGGIDPTTVGWSISGCPALRDSDYAGLMCFVGNTLFTNCAVDGDWYDINTDEPYVLESDSERFTIDGDELVYIGKLKRLARLSSISTCEPDSGSNLVFETRIVRKRSAVDAEVGGPFRFNYKTETITVPGNGLVLLEENDRLRQQVRRVGSTGLVRVDDSSLLSA